MAKFNFNLRNPQSKVKDSLQSKTPINLVIRWNNNRVVFPTGLSIKPCDWEGDKTKGKKYQRARPTARDHAELNSSLFRLEGMASKRFIQFVNDNNRQPTEEEYKCALLDAINPKTAKKADFFTFFEKFIEESVLKSNERTKRKYAKGTITIYSTTLKHLREFQKKRKDKKIDFNTIDMDFYYSFMEYLGREKRFGENYKGKLIKVIKLVLNDATERGINSNMAFKSKKFRAVSEDSENIYLNDDELKELYELDLRNNSRLERVRDLFYIGCQTGLRFSDLSRIKKENIIGNKLTIPKIIKTGGSIVIPLPYEVFEIMKKYDGNFPAAISNQKMNAYLKELCGMIPSLNQKIEIAKTQNGLKEIIQIEKYKLVKTHSARRSFATNCYLSKVPSFVIMGITGHKTESSFLKYIKMTPDDKANILEMYQNTKSKKSLLKVV